MAYTSSEPAAARGPAPKKSKLKFFVGLALGIFILDALNAFSGLIALLGR